jgi:hypothetical protein
MSDPPEGIRKKGGDLQSVLFYTTRDVTEENPAGAITAERLIIRRSVSVTLALEFKST